MPSTAAIMGYEFASRFGTFWSTLALIADLQSDNPEVSRAAQETKRRYAGYILEDLKYYDPSLIIIVKDAIVPTSETPMNFVEFFGDYKPLLNYIETNYNKEKDVFEFDRSAYFKGTTMNYAYMQRYDVYLRNGASSGSLNTKKNDAQ